MININNIFDYCNNSIDCNDVLFSTGENVGNTILTIAIKNDNNHIYTYSNEWLYLINSYYPDNPYYPNLINFYYNIINNKENIEIINEDVISFITCFSTGTVHGYSGLYNILSEYLNNYEMYKDKKILVAKNSQQGIIDIINHLFNKNIIDKDKIIYIDKNKIYHCHSITFIPNRFHIFEEELSIKVSNIMDRYIIPDRSDQLYYDSLNLPNNLDKVCIMKGTNSNNLTTDGVVPQNNIINFVSKWEITLIEPGIINEIPLIHCINQCKVFITTWGTSFLKNYIYVSDQCEKIIVLIIGDVFIGQYYFYLNNNVLKLKYKNANIIYKIVDYNLIFNLYE